MEGQLGRFDYNRDHYLGSSVPAHMADALREQRDRQMMLKLMRPAPEYVGAGVKPWQAIVAVVAVAFVFFLLNALIGV